MQLRNARLCLDCEEIHEAQQCPLCASETFAFMTRWVPAREGREGRNRPKALEPAKPEEFQTYRRMLTPDEEQQQVPRTGGWSMVQRGALGLALFGVAGWLWRSGGNEAEKKDGPDGHSGVS